MVSPQYHTTSSGVSKNIIQLAAQVLKVDMILKLYCLLYSEPAQHFILLGCILYKKNNAAKTQQHLIFILNFQSRIMPSVWGKKNL